MRALSAPIWSTICSRGISGSGVRPRRLSPVGPRSARGDQGDICDKATVATAVAGIDTIFHTAAIIDLMGGSSATEEYRQRSFAVNVGGTGTWYTPHRRMAGVKRFVYTASNSVVMGGQQISGGDETMPYNTFQRPLHRNQSNRREIRPGRERCNRNADMSDPPQRHLGTAAIRPCSARCSRTSSRAT